MPQNFRSFFVCLLCQFGRFCRLLPVDPAKVYGRSEAPPGRHLLRGEEHHNARRDKVLCRLCANFTLGHVALARASALGLAPTMGIESS